MPINTVYETFYPDRSFYSVEKAGFVTVGQLLYTMTNDILGTGSFRVVKAFFKDTQGGLIPPASAATNYSDWPIGERKFEFINRGSGYSVGETLILNEGNATVVTGKDFAVEVTKVDPATGYIMEVSSVPGVSYITPDPFQPQPMLYSTGTSVGSQTIGTVNPDHESGSIYSRIRVQNTYGTTSISTELAKTYYDNLALFNSFAATYGEKGSGWSGPEGRQFDGTATAQSTWPTTVGAVWAFASDTLGNVKVGQEIFVNTGVNPTLPNTVIPPGTRIISKKSVNVINRVTSSAGVYSITRADPAFFYQFSNIVSIDSGQTVSTRGYGAAVKYDTLVQPDVWDVILESTGAVDPMSDQAGVTANVSATTTSSNILLVSGLQTVNRYKPKIHPGQRLVSVTPLLLVSATASGTTVTAVTSVPHKLVNGNQVRVTGAVQPEYNGVYTVTVANAQAITYTVSSAPLITTATGPVGIQKIGSVTGRVFVESVVANSTVANVRLSTTQSLPANEEVQFVFEDPQFWRLRLRVTDPQTAEVYVGTELQVTDDGDYSYVWGEELAANGTPLSGNLNIVDVAGIIGNRPTGNVDTSGLHPWITVNPDKIDEGFVNRKTRVGAGIAAGLPGGNPETYPINYTMTITNRGLFFGIWESNWSVIQRKKTDKDSFFNWVLVQRPVNRINGEILTKGRTPLFCVNSVGYKYWKFVVREADMQHPTVGDPQLRTFKFDANTGNVIVQTTPYRVPADQNSQDSFAIINSAKQIALTEESKFLVSFLHNLTTPRFRYSEELDMMAQTSADVCMAGNDLAITAYTESLPRKYRAMPANDSYNTGLRVAILRDIPDLPEPNVS
jgi:hypothetical protein